jgi:serine/threonine-protein kinase
VPRVIGRYVLLDALASGGMATVHLGQLRGDSGFRRFVAVKVLRAELGRDPEARGMFMDEARLVSRIRHPNIVQTLDVLEDQDDLFLVMDYADGVPLSRLMKSVLGAGGRFPLPIVVAMVCDMLEGLHAAHQARGEDGLPLEIVHRDVSPQNVMVTRDGTAKVLDFGIARAADRAHLTNPGEIKGKAAYMAPEQARGTAMDRGADIYAAAIVLWELLCGRRLFQGESFAESLLKQLEMEPPSPGTVRADTPPELSLVVLRGLAKNRADRFATAQEMADAVAAAAPRASRAALSAYVMEAEAEFFRERDALLASSADAAMDPSVGPTAVAETLTVKDSVVMAPEAHGPIARSRRATIGILAGALVMMLALGAAVTLFARQKSQGAPLAQTLSTSDDSARDVPASTAAPPPSNGLASAAPIITSAPPTSAAEIKPRVGGAVARTSAPVAPASTPPAARSAPANTASAVPAAALPPCCAGTIQIRFGQCTDNCPK